MEYSSDWKKPANFAPRSLFSTSRLLFLLLLSSLLVLALLLGLPACSDDDEGPGEPPPITSEGAIDNPLSVAVDSSHRGGVGTGAEATSYYRFHTNVSGLYWIGLTDCASNLSWRLYAAGGFVDPPLEACDESADDGGEGCRIFLDEADTDYDLAVVNLGSSATNYSLSVQGAETMTPTGCGTAPVACIDFDDGQLPDGLVEFVMSGDADWVIDDADATRNGRYSIRSGTITDGQTSCFEFVAFGTTSTIGFNWMTQSEELGDVLALYADGVLVDVFSGHAAWNSWTRYGSLATGVLYKLCYEKNGAVSEGEDAAWIDDLWFR